MEQEAALLVAEARVELDAEVDRQVRTEALMRTGYATNGTNHSNTVKSGTTGRAPALSSPDQACRWSKLPTAR